MNQQNNEQTNNQTENRVPRRKKWGQATEEKIAGRVQAQIAAVMMDAELRNDTRFDRLERRIRINFNLCVAILAALAVIIIHIAS